MLDRHSSQPRPGACTWGIAADPAEMSYRPGGSAVTDVQGGRVASCGRHPRPLRSGFLIRAALALAAVGAAALVVSAMALPSSESQRTIRFLEIARSTQTRLIDHNGNRQPDMGDSIAGASNLFRWEGSRRGARLGHICASSRRGRAATARRPSSCLTGPSASWAMWSSTARPTSSRSSAAPGRTSAFAEASPRNRSAARPRRGRRTSSTCCASCRAALVRHAGRVAAPWTCAASSRSS